MGYRHVLGAAVVEGHVTLLEILLLHVSYSSTFYKTFLMFHADKWVHSEEGLF